MVEWTIDKTTFNKINICVSKMDKHWNCETMNAIYAYIDDVHKSSVQDNERLIGFCTFGGKKRKSKFPIK